MPSQSQICPVIVWLIGLNIFFIFIFDYNPEVVGRKIFKNQLGISDCYKKVPVLEISCLDRVSVRVPAVVPCPALTKCYSSGNWVMELLFLKTTCGSIITSKSSIKLEKNVNGALKIQIGKPVGLLFLFFVL